MSICEGLHAYIKATDKWVAGIQPFKRAVGLFRGSQHTLITPIHQLLILSCIKAKFYGVAADIMDEGAFDIDKKTAPFTVLDYLLYMYYGGMAYLGLKRFADASECFQLVLTAPSNAVSHVQIEAYKKFILCCLMVEGKIVILPEKLTSSTVLRMVERSASSYVKLGTLYGAQSVEKVRTYAKEHEEIFSKDGNLGLVKQTLEKLSKRKVRLLTQTYVTVSLDNLAKRAQLSSRDEAERVLLSMIEDGELHATIDETESMVTFHDDPEGYDHTEATAQLDAKMREAMALYAHLEQKHLHVQLDQKFLKVVCFSLFTPFVFFHFFSSFLFHLVSKFISSFGVAFYLFLLFLLCSFATMHSLSFLSLTFLLLLVSTHLASPTTASTTGAQGCRNVVRPRCKALYD